VVKVKEKDLPASLELECERCQKRMSYIHFAQWDGGCKCYHKTKKQHGPCHCGRRQRATNLCTLCFRQLRSLGLLLYR
jgi:hypothetical protein